MTLRGKLFAIALIASVVVWASLAFHQKTTALRPAVSPKSSTTTDVSQTPRTLAELLALKPEELERVDIGLMNLLCAEGLTGSESADVRNYFARLDGIAQHVKAETERHLYRFRNNPEEFNRSEGYFRMLFMAVTLQEDFRMHYNPERIRQVGDFEPNDVFFADSRDVFIHGLMADDRRMGTCSSMPVLYVAVGRRLGYPLKLVPTQNHLFVRWEGSRDRFNVDATGRGMNMYDDDYFRQWPVPISPEDEQALGYLKSMTAADELTAFLSLRGECLFAMGKIQEGLEAEEAALRFSPNSRLQQLITANARERYLRRPDPIAYLPPEQHPSWPQRRRVIIQQPNLPGMESPIPPDPNPINKIRNQ